MEELSRQDRVARRALRLWWRRFKRQNSLVLWAVVAVTCVSIWLGIEREFFYCVDSEDIGLFERLPDCDCEQDGDSRWRYGRCDFEPVEWSMADSVLLVNPVWPTEAGTRPRFELEVIHSFRGGMRNGEHFFLEGVDARRLLAEIDTHPHGAIDEPFIVMLRALGPGVDGLLFLDGGYYPVTGGTATHPETVLLHERDIQIFSAETGAAYLAPVASAPIRDFMFSLWLGWPTK